MESSETFSSPKRDRNDVTAPVSAVKILTRLQTTTREMKCGIYEMVWVTRLKAVLLTSFKSSASRIGAGKPKTSVARLMVRVFFRSRQK